MSFTVIRATDEFDHSLTSVSQVFVAHDLAKSPNVALVTTKAAIKSAFKLEGQRRAARQQEKCLPSLSMWITRCESPILLRVSL